MEWVYGVMFRACEEQESLTFALELWQRELTELRMSGIMGLCADIVKYHVSISSVDTLSRFCGAMSRRVFESVSGQCGCMDV